ncbi:MAG: hypothetical protein ACRC28_19120 [Clostridium sp.]|uniref:hypothetical protein n=1 Tax=Clostridium sp. TaxID=1506 RepID=UPI003F402BA0
MKRFLIKWGILGISVGAIIGIVGNYKLLKDETRTVEGKGPIELKVKEFKNLNKDKAISEKEALIKEIDIENNFLYDGMTLEKEDVYIQVFVFNKTKNMKLKDEKYLELDGEVIGKSLTIGGEVYGALNSLEPNIKIEEESLLNGDTDKREKVDYYLIKAKVLEDGSLKAIKKEKKKSEEFLSYNKQNEGKSDLYEYKDKYNIDIEKIKKEVNKKERFYEVNEIEILNSEGRYYFLELFNKNMEITYVLGDREKDKIYIKKNKNENASIKGGFLYDGEIYLLERKGDIYKVKENNKTIKIIEEYKNDKRNESAIEFNLIGIEGENVYFRNALPLDSLMSFNLKEKNFNLVYDSRYEVMENMDMKDGYITFYENSKESNKKIIGYLENGKIDAKIKDIVEEKNSITRIYKERAVIVSKDDKGKVKIKILKL